MKNKSNIKNKTIRFRASKETYRILITRSEFFANGNISEFIRKAIENYRVTNGNKKADSK